MIVAVLIVAVTFVRILITHKCGREFRNNGPFMRPPNGTKNIEFGEVSSAM
jgi:hypothetical protein